MCGLKTPCKVLNPHRFSRFPIRPEKSTQNRQQLFEIQDCLTQSTVDGSTSSLSAAGCEAIQHKLVKLEETREKSDDDGFAHKWSQIGMKHLRSTQREMALLVRIHVKLDIVQRQQRTCSDNAIGVPRHCSNNIQLESTGNMNQRALV